MAYKDGELKTAIAGVTPNSALALQLCGDGAIGCTDTELVEHR